MSENKLPFDFVTLIQYFKPKDIGNLPKVPFTRIYDGINPVREYDHATGQKVFAEVASDFHTLRKLQFIIVEVEKGKFKKMTFIQGTNRFDQPAIGFKQFGGYVELNKDNKHHLLAHINSFYERIEE